MIDLGLYHLTTFRAPEYDSLRHLEHKGDRRMTSETLTDYCESMSHADRLAYDSIELNETLWDLDDEIHSCVERGLRNRMSSCLSSMSECLDEYREIANKLSQALTNNEEVYQALPEDEDDNPSIREAWEAFEVTEENHNFARENADAIAQYIDYYSE